MLLNKRDRKPEQIFNPELARQRKINPFISSFQFWETREDICIFEKTFIVSKTILKTTFSLYAA